MYHPVKLSISPKRRRCNLNDAQSRVWYYVFRFTCVCTPFSPKSIISFQRGCQINRQVLLKKMVVINSNDPRGVVFKKQTSENQRAASFPKIISDLVEQTEHHRSPLCATQLKTDDSQQNQASLRAHRWYHKCVVRFDIQTQGPIISNFFFYFGEDLNAQP